MYYRISFPFEFWYIKIWFSVKKKTKYIIYLTENMKIISNAAK